MAASAAAVVAVVGTVAGAVSILSGDPSASDPEIPPVVGVAADEPWAERANSVFATWAGTPADQQAAEVVVAYSLNGAYSDCMAGKGLSRPWDASIAPASVYEDPLLYSFWAANRLDGYYSQKVINGEISQRQENAANSVDTEGDEASAEQACRREAPGASDADVTETRTPKVVRDLIGAWTESLARVVIAGGDFKAYDTCIENSGVLKRLGATSTDQARNQLSSLMAPGSVPLEGEQPTKEWTAYLEREHMFVEADWACREHVRDGLGDEVSAAVDDFAAGHASQIEQARSHWEAVTAEATKLGWSSEDPDAGAASPSR